MVLLQVSVGLCSFASGYHERYEQCRTFRICRDDGVWHMHNSQLGLVCALHRPLCRSMLCCHPKNVFFHNVKVNPGRCQEVISGRQQGSGAA